MLKPVRNFTITGHARGEMARRAIGEAVVRRVLENPEQRNQVRAGRDVLQARFSERGKVYLIRVFVDIDPTPAKSSPSIERVR